MRPGDDVRGSRLDGMKTPGAGVDLERSVSRHHAYDVLTVPLVLRMGMAGRTERAGSTLPLARTTMTTHAAHCAAPGTGEDNAEGMGPCRRTRMAFEVEAEVQVKSDSVRLVIAPCQVDYTGRLTAHLPWAKRLIVVKSDNSVSVHADDRAYKPLNWMSSPCTLSTRPCLPDEPAATAAVDAEVEEVWEVDAPTGDHLQILLGPKLLDVTEELGADPGLQKDGVEAHLQELLAENPDTFGAGWSLVRREYMTPIGPVDLLCRDAEGVYVAVEVKRRGEIDGVEQLTRYLELMNRDHLLGDRVRGVFAAQKIKPQARTLATDRGIECVTVDYDALRGMDHPEDRLF